MSSFESISATLSEENWGINQPVWAERNYPCDNFIHAFFGANHSNVSAVGAHALQRQTWQCMIAQALAQKQYTEALRSMNTVLVQFWQYVDTFMIPLSSITSSRDHYSVTSFDLPDCCHPDSMMYHSAIRMRLNALCLSVAFRL